MSLPWELGLTECESTNRIVNSAENLELNHCYCNGFFNCFDGLRFRELIEKKQTLFAPTKVTSLRSGVYTYELTNSEWIPQTKNLAEQSKN